MFTTILPPGRDTNHMPEKQEKLIENLRMMSKQVVKSLVLDLPCITMQVDILNLRTKDRSLYRPT